MVAEEMPRAMLLGRPPIATVAGTLPPRPRAIRTLEDSAGEGASEERRGTRDRKHGQSAGEEDDGSHHAAYQTEEAQASLDTPGRLENEEKTPGGGGTANKKAEEETGEEAFQRS